jgi:hypothetical protein
LRGRYIQTRSLEMAHFSNVVLPSFASVFFEMRVRWRRVQRSQGERVQD